MKSWLGTFLVLALVLGASGCDADNANQQKIEGVTCTTRYLGKVYAWPISIYDQSSGFFYQRDDGTVQYYSLSNDSVRYNDLGTAIQLNRTLYLVEFSENATNGYSTSHVVFFPFQPTAEQILPYIPEKARVQPTPIPTPAPTPTVITPEKEPGK